MQSFSKSWNSSKKPKKQRKYLYNAPKHVVGNFLHSHLSDELSKKYEKRSVRIKKGDRVKIMVGQFKGKSGKVEKVFANTKTVYIEGVDMQKKEGAKIKYPVNVSNLMITELDMSDKKRQECLKRK